MEKGPLQVQRTFFLWGEGLDKPVERLPYGVLFTLTNLQFDSISEKKTDTQKCSPKKEQIRFPEK